MSKAKTYTITEAAKKLGISRQAVHEAIRKGQIEAQKTKIIRVISGFSIPAKSLDAYEVSDSHKRRGKKS
mgnify:CR=1 FL=1